MRKVRMRAHPNRISWVGDFLDRQTRDALLRYLAVTHCGRGRGDYSDPREFPLFWQQETERVLEEQKENLHSHWNNLQASTDSPRQHDPNDKMVRLLTQMTTDILLKCYPEAKTWL